MSEAVYDVDTVLMVRFGFGWFEIAKGLVSIVLEIIV